jgi:ABC-type uncharacterized transport system ATPase subunit
VGVVFSSHQLDLVEDVCQDVVIIDHGRIVLTGEVDVLKAASLRRSLEVRVDGQPWVPVLPGVTVATKQDGRQRVLVDASVDQPLSRQGALRSSYARRFPRVAAWTRSRVQVPLDRSCRPRLDRPRRPRFHRQSPKLSPADRR